MNTLSLDRLGGVASATCALHCLLLTLAPALVTLLGVEFLAHEVFEWGFFATAVTFAVVAAALGYGVHRNPWVLASFGAGVVVLVAGRLGEALDLYEGAVVLAVTGGLVLVASHAFSARQTRACQGACCP